MDEEGLRVDSLRGKTVMVTGATSGLGLETAAGLARMGATVLLASRNPQKTERSAADLRKRCPDADIIVAPPLDFASQDGVRKFAKEFAASGRPLHLLVNNAGANYLQKPPTDEGIGALCQVNYLGPYTLSRLLESRLIASAPSRIVNVSSVTHRYGWVDRDIKRWMQSPQGNYYPSTKLANVLHAYESQRRLGTLGVDACAVDPGASWTGIWANSFLFQKTPLRHVLTALYGPPRDNAKALLHACTDPWPRKPQDGANGERQQLRYYARGWFASSLMTWYGKAPGLLNKLQYWIWGPYIAIPLSLIDWPTRWLSQGKLAGRTVTVRSAPASYDKELARDLWDVSADVAKVPRQPVKKAQ